MKTSIVREKMRRGEPILMAKINFMNPDMTELRLIITYPTPYIGMLISAVICTISLIIHNIEDSKDFRKLWKEFTENLKHDMTDNTKK